MRTYKLTRSLSVRGREQENSTIVASTFLITSSGAAVFYNGTDNDVNLDVIFAVHADEWETIEVIEE